MYLAKRTPDNHAGVPGTWNFVGNNERPTFWCPTCGAQNLQCSAHGVQSGGMVNASVVCHQGCGFHDFVKLDEWYVKVLTVLQPYAHFIVYGDSVFEFGQSVDPDKKDIENRTRRLNYRGRLYIHAGMRWYDGGAPEEIEQIIAQNREKWNTVDDTRGHIIGFVDVVDCVTQSDSPWFSGPIGLVLKNATAIEPIPAKGKQGLWHHPLEIKHAADLGDDNG